MSYIYKVTSAIIGKTKRDYEFYKLQFNNSFWATKLLPSRKYDHDELYKRYKKNNDSLEFLVGKYIHISLEKTEYGFEFNRIYSFDVINDFNKELEYSKGKAFSTDLPIYDFLLCLKRTVEPDGSIKLSTNFGDMRISKMNGLNVCYQHDRSNEYLNIFNVKLIFDKYYKDVPLPPYSTGKDKGDNSYYKISMKDVAIVKMNNHVKVSYKMTTSGDYDKWLAEVVMKIGDKLTSEQTEYLSKLCTKSNSTTMD